MLSIPRPSGHDRTPKRTMTTQLHKSEARIPTCMEKFLDEHMGSAIVGFVAIAMSRQAFVEGKSGSDIRTLLS